MTGLRLARRAAWVSCGLLLVAGCCPRQKEGAQPKAPALPTAEVRVQPATTETRTETDEVVGTVRSKLTARVAAKIAGTVARVLVTPGQTVKTGDLLVELDAKETESQQAQAKAMLEQAETELARFTKLLGEQAVTRQEFDNVQTRQRVAKAKLEEVATMLSYARITAPFDGMVSAKLVDRGDMATPGRPLLEIDDPKAMRLEAFVPEATAGKVKAGETFTVRVEALSGDIRALVSEVSPTADPTSRTFLAKLDLPADSGVKSGQFGRVLVPVAEVQALTVPEAALVIRGQLEMVFVAEADGRAHMRLVKAGKRAGGKVELLSGVAVGESVVVENAAGLTDGQPVRRLP